MRKFEDKSMKYLIAAVVGVVVVAVIVGYFCGIFASVQIFSTLCLVVITAWYAWNTYRLLKINQIQQLVDYFLIPLWEKLEMIDYDGINRIFDTPLHSTYSFLFSQEENKLLNEIKERAKKKNILSEDKERYRKGIEKIINRLAKKYHLPPPSRWKVIDIPP